MKLEPGRMYITRDETKATITEVDNKNAYGFLIFNGGKPAKMKWTYEGLHRTGSFGCLDIVREDKKDKR